MILKIECDSDSKTMLLRLIGRIEAELLPDLRARIQNEARMVVLDLADVQLVDLDVVRFLRLSEDSGVGIQNCPPYIREWIAADGKTGKD